MAKQTQSADHSHIVSILSYVIVGVIWYFADKSVQSSALAKFHVKQSINLFVFSLGTTVVFTITIILIPLLFITNVVFLMFWILGIINAVNSKKKELPIIGGFADKYLTF